MINQKFKDLKLKDGQHESILPMNSSFEDIIKLDPCGTHSFSAKNYDFGLNHIFGGQVLAQALRAAQLTVTPDRNVHSLHAYFIRPGFLNSKVIYHVENNRDGNSFSNRRVTASQKEKVILDITLSFQKKEEGFEHQISLAHDTFQAPINFNPSEQAHLPFRMTQETESDTEVKYKNIWFKTATPLPEDPQIHQCAIAYLSDLQFLSSALLPHDLSYENLSQVASIDHSIWFYHSHKADQWFLHRIQSDITSSARGHNRGHLYNTEGKLFAVTSQEGLIRP